MVELIGIEKNYQSKKALDDINFSIPKGIIFGLLGPNGAGKSSLIRILANIIKPDKGIINFSGGFQSSKIGYLPEERGLYKSMKVGEQLEYLCRLKSIDSKQTKINLKYWAERLEIDSWLKKPVDSLSKGMQQKIQFISAVIHQPDFLILDEPFTGFDPINAQIIEDQIHLLVKNGTTVLLSTHRLEQAEGLCQHVVMLHNGKVVLNGELDDIKNSIPIKNYIIEIGSEIENENEFYKVILKNKNKINIEIKNKEINQVIQNLISHTDLHLFAPDKPSLSQIFQDKVQNS